MSQLRSGASAPRSPCSRLRTGVLFPGTVLTLPVGRPRSVALLNAVHAGDVIGVIAQRDPKREDPRREDLHDIGTFARVVDISRVSNGCRLVIEGLIASRSRPWSRPTRRLAEGTLALEFLGDAEEARLLAGVAARARPRGRPEDGDQPRRDRRDEPGGAGRLRGSGRRRRSACRPKRRWRCSPSSTCRAAAPAGSPACPPRRPALADLKKKSTATCGARVGKASARRSSQRSSGPSRRSSRAARRARTSCRPSSGASTRPSCPEEARAVADRELRRLDSIGPQSAEHNVIRTYLEWIADLPWSERAEVKDDLDAVKKLDEDHRGLDDVKRRILRAHGGAQAGPEGKRARSCASRARPASARPRWASRSPTPWAASSRASAWAGCTTRPRCAAIAAPTSARCPARSSRRSARRARATACSCSTRSTRWAAACMATRRRRCWKCSTPSRTARSATTTWTCRSISAASCSSPRPTCSDTILGPLRDRMEII